MKAAADTTDFGKAKAARMQPDKVLVFMMDFLGFGSAKIEIVAKGEFECSARLRELAVDVVAEPVRLPRLSAKAFAIGMTVGGKPKPIAQILRGASDERRDKQYLLDCPFRADSVVRGLVARLNRHRQLRLISDQ
jgi:hypothetical protein